MNRIGSIILRFAITLLMAGLISIALSTLASNWYVHHYMHINNITNRSELSKDYGFGISGLLITLLVFLVSLLVSGVATWLGLRRISIFKNKQLHS